MTKFHDDVHTRGLCGAKDRKDNPKYTEKERRSVNEDKQGWTSRKSLN